MQYFCVSTPPTVRPNLLRQMGVGSLNVRINLDTCRARGTGGQAHASLYSGSPGGTDNDCSLSSPARGSNPGSSDSTSGQGWQRRGQSDGLAVYCSAVAVFCVHFLLSILYYCFCFLFLQVSLKYQSDLLKLIQTVTFSPFYITGNRSV